MAYFTRKLPSEKSETITLGDGVNTFNTVYTIKRSEAVDSRNVSSRHYPALSTRGGVVSSFSALTTPNGATARNGADLHVVDGTTWKRWDSGSFTNVETGLTNSLANFVEFKQQTTTYTIMFNGTEKKAYNGSTVTDITQAVATRLICVDDTRLYTLKNAEVKCSALYDPFDFTTVFDSHNIRISAMEGTETALVGYEGTKIAFSDKTMHVIMGDDFRDFQVMDPIKTGCVSQRSIAECNGILYFMDYGKYKMFSGGFPSDVSQKAKKYLEGINYAQKERIVSGVQGKYIYLSIPYGGSATSNNMTLEYDTEFNNWYPISTGYANFVNIGVDLFGVKADGNIEKMNSGDWSGTWYHETGVLSPTPIRPNKTLSDMWLEIDLPSSSSMIISYSTTADSEDFVTLFTFTGSANEQKARVKIPTNVLANKERYRLKFSGTGTAKIHFLEIYERVKGR